MDDKAEIIAILKDLISLPNNTQDTVYLTEYKNQVEKPIKDLESAISGNNKNNQTDSKGFFQPKVLIPVVLVTIVLVCLAAGSGYSFSTEKENYK